MEKLFVDKWFKAPPKESSRKILTVEIKPRGYGRKKAKSGKSCKKIKK